MADLTLDVARKILDTALAKGVEKKLKPLVVTVLDARGCVKISAAQDGTSLLRSEIAHGKAYGALAMGMGSRALFQRAQEQAYFIGAVNTLAQGRMVPVPGGVLIQDGATLLGAVGVAGHLGRWRRRLDHGSGASHDLRRAWRCSLSRPGVASRRLGERAGTVP